MTTLWSSSKCLIYTVVGAFVLIIVTLIVTFMHHGSTSPQPHPAPPPGLGAAVLGGASEGNSASERTSGTTQQPGSDAVPGLVSETPPGGGGVAANTSRTSDADSPILRRPQDGSSSSGGTPLSAAGGNDTTGVVRGSPWDSDEGIPRLHDPSKSVVEYIKPTKILAQLHDNDLLYDSKTMSSETTGAHLAPKFYGTGLFRNRSSRIWDPHPEYEIDAFGLKMHIKLSHDRSFMPEDIKVTHIFSSNETLRRPEDHMDHNELQRCYYKGRVVGDDKSAVAVSLCEGMRGHIRTSRGSFFIEPRQKYSNENTNIWHAISRERGGVVENAVDSLELDGPTAQDDGSNCAVDTEQEEHDQQLEDIELTDGSPVGDGDDSATVAAPGGANGARRTLRTTSTQSRCWWRWIRRCRSTTRIRSSRTC